MKYRLTVSAYNNINLVYGKLSIFCEKEKIELQPGRLVSPELHKLNELGDEFNLICAESEPDGIMEYVNKSALAKSDVSIIFINQLRQLIEL